MALHKLISLFIVANTAALILGDKDIHIEDIRLQGSPDDIPNAGRVEVLANDKWREVCHGHGRDEWSIDEAMVACRQLGYPGTAMKTRGGYGQGSLGRSIDSIECDGDEDTLNDCDDHEMEDECDAGDEAGVICTVPGYLGCFRHVREDTTNIIILPDKLLKHNGMTIKKCKDICSNKTSTIQYAGLQNGRECICAEADTDLDRLGLVWDSKCDVPCSGNRDEICGGENEMSIYDVHQGICSDPTPPNGFTLEQDFSFGKWATLQCNPGYRFDGEERLQHVQCVLGNEPNNCTWSGNPPSCIEGTRPETTLVPPGPTPTRKPKPNTTPRAVSLPVIPTNNGDSQTSSSIGVIAGLISACALVFLVIIFMVVAVFFNIRSRKATSGNAEPAGQPLAFDGPYDLIIGDSSNSPPPYTEQPIYTIPTCPPYDNSATTSACASSASHEPPPPYSTVAAKNAVI